MKPPFTIAALKFASGGNQALRVQKQVYELTLDDFDKSPVWEFRLEEDGKDESTVRPYATSGPLDPAERMFVVRAVFILADGSRMQGYCSPPLQGDDSIGILQPIIITNRGQVRFWCGTTAPDLKRLTRNYEWLGKAAQGVFPLQFQSDIPLVGGPVRGSLPGFLVLEDFQTRKTKTLV